DRVGLERAEGVLIVGGGEHDHDGRRQACAHVEAVERGHRDVEEHEVEVRVCGDLVERLFGVGGLTDDLDQLRGLEHAREAPEGEGFVVDEKYALHGTGSSIVTVVVGVGVSGTVSFAALPYRVSRRMRSVSRPWSGRCAGLVKPGPSSVTS